MLRISLGVLLLLFTLGSSGYMSLVTHGAFPAYKEESNRVYSGVRTHLEGKSLIELDIRDENNELVFSEVSKMILFDAYMLGIDLPLCVVADTLLLPLSLEQQREGK